MLCQVQVDAFAEGPYKGNATSICLLDTGAVASCTPAVMANIAKECNQSEAAFVFLKHESETFSDAAEFDLRWFEPEQEDLLCGHGTLASAAAIFQGVSCWS